MTINFQPTPVRVVAASGATQALTFSPDGQPVCYDVTLTASCTFSVSGAIPGVRNEIRLVIRTGAGAFTVTMPGGIQWHNNAPPTFTVVASKVIDLSLSSPDGGTTLIGK